MLLKVHQPHPDCGGGIRTREDAQVVAAAGADIIVTGTVVEESSNVKNRIKTILEGINSV